MGCIGAGALLIGFHSWNMAVRESDTKWLNTIMKLIAFGITMTPLGHFVIACMTPMAYKSAVLAGANQAMAEKIIAFWATYMYPVKITVVLIVILIQSVVMIALILRKKIDCPKWMVICNPLGLVILSIPLAVVLSGTGLEGIVEAFESLGEGLIYLPVYLHWNRKNRA